MMEITLARPWQMLVLADPVAKAWMVMFWQPRLPRFPNRRNLMPRARIPDEEPHPHGHLWISTLMFI